MKWYVEEFNSRKYLAEALNELEYEKNHTPYRVHSITPVRDFDPEAVGRIDYILIYERNE